MSVLLCVLVFVISFGYFSGYESHEMSAGELYDACGSIQVPDDQVTADTVIAVQKCNAFARRTFQDSGYKIVYIDDDGCPPYASYMNITPGKIFVQYWNEEGMGVRDRYLLGANDAALRAFREAYPQCPQFIAATRD